jgi:hypothetical protein
MGWNPWEELARQPDILMAVLPLPAGDSWWLPDERAIVLHSRLNRAERKCALAHELIHAERADVALADPILAAKQERAVDCEAARRLISLDALTDALMWTAHRRELADTLGVDVPTAFCRLSHLTELELDYIRGRWAAREVSA